MTKCLAYEARLCHKKRHATRNASRSISSFQRGKRMGGSRTNHFLPCPRFCGKNTSPACCNRFVAFLHQDPRFEVKEGGLGHECFMIPPGQMHLASPDQHIPGVVVVSSEKRTATLLSTQTLGAEFPLGIPDLFRRGYLFFALVASRFSADNWRGFVLLASVSPLLEFA